MLADGISTVDSSMSRRLTCGKYNLVDHHDSGQRAIFRHWDLCLEEEKTYVVLVGQYGRRI